MLAPHCRRKSKEKEAEGKQRGTRDGSTAQDFFALTTATNTTYLPSTSSRDLDCYHHVSSYHQDTWLPWNLLNTPLVISLRVHVPCNRVTDCLSQDEERHKFPEVDCRIPPARGLFSNVAPLDIYHVQSLFPILLSSYAVSRGKLYNHLKPCRLCLNASW